MELIPSWVVYNLQSFLMAHPHFFTHPESLDKVTNALSYTTYMIIMLIKKFEKNTTKKFKIFLNFLVVLLVQIHFTLPFI